MPRRRHAISLIERDRLVREAVEGLPGPLGELLLDALMAPADERAVHIGAFHRDPRTRTFAELLIDLEEDRQLALDFAQALKDARTRGDVPLNTLDAEEL